MKNNYIVIKERHCRHRIAYESILYVAVKGRYCHVHTSQLLYSIRCRLMDLLDGPASKFLTQVHRAFAVNMHHVTGFCRHELFIYTHRIPVGRAYYNEVNDLFVNTT